MAAVPRAEDEAERWLGRAYAEVWAERPRPGASGGGDLASTVPLDGIKALLLSAWIDTQIRYQRRAMRRYERRHRNSRALTAAFFALTLAAAVAHGIEDRGMVVSVPLGSLPIFLSIALPAAAAAVAAISTQREYPRNAQRAYQMARDLEEVRRRLAHAATLEGVREIAQEAEEVMLVETRDWLVVMRFHDFELHV